MRILVIHQSRYGQTAKIAHQIAHILQGRDHSVDVRSADALPVTVSPRTYDGVIVGASVYWLSLPRAVRAFARAYAPLFARMPAWLFTVSLSAANGELGKARVARVVDAFQRRTKWVPGRIEYFAGALAWPKYGPVTRRVARWVARRAGLDVDGAELTQIREYTDWHAVRAFTLDFERHVAPRALHDVSAERGEFARVEVDTEESEAPTLQNHPVP